MDLKLTGKTCLVTGASAGCGEGVARTLAAEGATVAITARRRELLDTLAADIAQSGAIKPIVLCGDIMQHDDIIRVCAEVRDAIGPIDILINAAGGSRPIPVESGDDVWQEAFDLNFHSARRFTHELLPSMRERKFGRVINFGGSMEPRSLNAAIAAKAAINLWAKGLSCDVAAEGVTINTIAPGRIDSEQMRERLYPTAEAKEAFTKANIPAGYFGDPEDIANIVCYLASPLGRYITGAVIPVDGGMHNFAH